MAKVPGVKQVGLKFGRATGGGVDVDFGGSVTNTGASPEALHAFLECLKEQNGRHNVTVAGGVDLTLEPIGQVADHWKGDNDLRLMLMPGGDESILNNLRIGPAAGSKSDVIQDWCGADQAGACVKCTPDRPSETTRYVEIELQPNPTVERKQMPGIWPGANPGGKLEAWQLVDADGKRFIYACKH